MFMSGMNMWLQKGDTCIGNHHENYLLGIAISYDGLIVAMGATQHYTTLESCSNDSKSGQVQVFHWSKDAWS